MHSYPFHSVTVNGREISIRNIVTNNTDPITPFETETLGFMRDWLTEKENFSFPTSGSTGVAKIISFTRTQIMGSAQATIEALALKRFDTAAVCIHTKYIGGAMMLVRALLNGMKIICCEPSANPFINGIDWTIDFIALVPLQVKAIVEDDKVTMLNKIKTVIIGGAPLDAATQKTIYTKVSAATYATFGMTETISHIALKRLDKFAVDFNYHTLPGVTVSTDNRNCLTIQVPYLKEQVVTNDVCIVQSPTTFEWESRYDEVINSGGIKINPSALEEKIAAVFTDLKISQSFFIFPKADDKTGERVALAVEGERWLKSANDELMNHLQKALPKYQIPKAIYFIPQFTLTESGKINRFRTLKNVDIDG